MNKRLNNISLLRLFSILLIFIFHIIHFATDISRQYFPLYFGVQIFLAISGFLYAQKKITNYKQFYAKNFLKIIIPVILLFFFIIFFVLIINPQNLSLSHIIEYFSLEKFSIGHLWFIPAILFCYLLLPVLQMATEKSNKNYKLSLSVVITILFLEIPFMFFTGSQVVVYIFIIGYLLGKSYQNITTDSKIKGGGEDRPLTIHSRKYFILFCKK